MDCLPILRLFRDILINANDRSLRLFRLDEHDGIPILQNKFQDLVNRVQWNQACFSSDGEYVIGGKVMHGTEGCP